MSILALAFEASADRAGRGRAVFDRAGCSACHSDPYLTNNRVVPAPEIGTEPTRARAMKKSRPVGPGAYPFDTPAPLPADARGLPVPTEGTDPGQVKLALAQGDSPGGDKVPSLVGLTWTAPYLHDGGVTVVADAATQLGVPGTALAFRRADPANSLRALVDRASRAKVLAASRASGSLRAAHVTGAGHEFWADGEAGVSRDDQDALIHYLLTFSPPHR